MSIQDVIKKSFLEFDAFSNSFTPAVILQIVLALISALILGMFINFVYKKFYSGVVYNRNFSISLVGMTVLTAVVTLAISTNIVISLGMVGALSIVRFRSAIKNPLDLVYLFWAITGGITIGAYMYPLAIVSAIVVFIMIVLLTKKSNGSPVYIVVVRYNGDTASDGIKIAMGRMNYRIKSKTLRGDMGELAMEVALKGDNLSFADKLRLISGVQDVTVIQYDGEYNN